jgi:hypothetical protein
MSEPSFKDTESISSLAPSSRLALTVETDLEAPKPTMSVPESGGLSAMPILQAVNAAAALLERTPFAIDDAKDDEEGSDDLGGAADDDQVMDEVCLFKMCISPLV